jgi:hypothetical protein
VVTEIVPVEAPPGTGTVIEVLLHAVGVADVAPNATALVPCVPPKFVPVMITEVPTGPPAGVKLVTVGAPTVNEFALVPVPAPVVTPIAPVVAPAGTVAVI